MRTFPCRPLTAFAAISILFVQSHAEADCGPPSKTDFVAAARTQFECSSARKLKELPQGDQEFQIHLQFPSEPAKVEKLPWDHIDFKKEPEQFLKALLAYGIKDNAVSSVDWRVEKNSKSTWCHAPWWHEARERLHGMTRERGSRIKELHPLQINPAVNWAVGFYNGTACHALGKVWANPSFPKTKDFAFPVGSFAIKLLFTSATPREVPYLTGSKMWNAAIGDDGSVSSLRLLQVDVAVRATDTNDFTGWLFGTFMYDAYTPGETVWEKLLPVGLMWGNDPELTSFRYEERGGVPEQAWLNPRVAEKFYFLPRHNLGLHGRVNGPVDNSKSACLACHGHALDWGRGIISESVQAEEAASLLPFAPQPYDAAAVRKYFRNLRPGQAYVAGTQSLDYSLQLAGGIEHFRSWVLRNFPDQAEHTSDVPPFKFESDKELTTQESFIRYMNELRSQASAMANPQNNSPFSRGD